VRAFQQVVVDPVSVEGWACVGHLSINLVFPILFCQRFSSVGIENLPVDRFNEGVDCLVIVWIEWSGKQHDGFYLPGVFTNGANEGRVPGDDPTGVVPVVVEDEGRPSVTRTALRTFRIHDCLLIVPGVTTDAAQQPVGGPSTGQAPRVLWMSYM